MPSWSRSNAPGEAVGGAQEPHVQPPQPPVGRPHVGGAERQHRGSVAAAHHRPLVLPPGPFEDDLYSRPRGRDRDPARPRRRAHPWPSPDRASRCRRRGRRPGRRPRQAARPRSSLRPRLLSVSLRAQDIPVLCVLEDKGRGAETESIRVFANVVRTFLRVGFGRQPACLVVDVRVVKANHAVAGQEHHGGAPGARAVEHQSPSANVVAPPYGRSPSSSRGFITAFISFQRRPAQPG